MDNKFNESKLANHIGFVLSEIIMSVGGAFLVLALIEMATNENYTFEPSYTVYETHILMMVKYGLGLMISGVFSLIACVSNISKIEAQANAPAQKLSSEQTDIGDDIEAMKLADIDEFVDKKTQE